MKKTRKKLLLTSVACVFFSFSSHAHAAPTYVPPITSGSGASFTIRINDPGGVYSSGAQSCMTVDYVAPSLINHQLGNRNPPCTNFFAGTDYYNAAGTNIGQAFNTPLEPNGGQDRYFIFFASPGGPNGGGEDSLTNAIYYTYAHVDDAGNWTTPNPPLPDPSFPIDPTVPANCTSFLIDCDLSTSTVYVDSNFGSSTLPDATKLITFLNVPYLLQTKVPFAYIFQIKDGLFGGLQSSSSTALPAGIFTWKISNSATNTTDMFSTTTISRYLTPTYAELWRGFLLVILYADFGYALYMRAKAQHLI